MQKRLAHEGKIGRTEGKYKSRATSKGVEGVEKEKPKHGSQSEAAKRHSMLIRPQ